MSISNTERNILVSAEAVFLRKGLDASTMQDIANEAGISRTLLHYYHRNKSTLFKAILTHTLDEFLPIITQVMEQDISLNEKGEKAVDCYIEFLLSKPLIPAFITLELQRDPDYLLNHIRERGSRIGNLDFIREQVRKELNVTGNIDEALAHMFTTMYALIMYPFLVRPLLDKVLLRTPDDFKNFMRQKKPLIINMLNTLKMDLLKISEEEEPPSLDDGNPPPPDDSSTEMFQTEFFNM